MLLLLALAAIYLPFTLRTIEQDEAYSLRHYAISPAHALLSYTAPNNHILHSLALWGSTTLFGSSIIAVRFPALVGALLSVAYAYRLGRRLGGHVGGLIAAALLGALPPLVEFAVTARGYSLSIVLAFVLLDLTVLKKTRRVNGYALLALSAVLVLTLPSTLYLLVATGIWLIAQERRAALTRIIPMAIGTLAGSLFYLAAILSGALREYMSTFGAADGVESLSLFVQGWVVEVFRNPLVDVLVVPGLALGIYALVREPGRRSLLTWMGVQLLVLLVFGSAQLAATDKLFFPRAFLFWLAPLVLIAGVGLARLPGASILPLALVVCAGVVIQEQRVIYPYDVLRDGLDHNLQEGDALILGCCIAEPAWYELQQEGRDDLLYVTPATRRLLIVEESDKFDAILDNYGLRDLVDTCASAPEWSPLSVVACRVKR